MKYIKIILALLLFVSLRAAAFAEPGDGMEGSNWEYRPKGVLHWFAFWNRDYLVFQQGNFIKAGLVKHGFTPSLYAATKTGEGIVWSAPLQSPQEGKMEWKGLRTSYWMEGTYTRIKPSGSTKTVKWKAWQVFPPPLKP